MATNVKANHIKLKNAYVILLLLNVKCMMLEAYATLAIKRDDLQFDVITSLVGSIQLFFNRNHLLYLPVDKEHPVSFHWSAIVGRTGWEWQWQDPLSSIYHTASIFLWFIMAIITVMTLLIITFIFIAFLITIFVFKTYLITIFTVIAFRSKIVTVLKF